MTENKTPKADDLPLGWFNQVCAALGLFDGARPVSVQSVLWAEVLPAIEALKANNPEAAVLVRENQRAYRLWSEALGRLAEANRRADGALNRWHELRDDYESLRRVMRESARTADAVDPQDGTPPA